MTLPEGFPRFKSPRVEPVKRRNPLRRWSSKRRRRDRDLANAREIVAARSHGRCEAQVSSTVCAQVGDQAHHRLPRRQGGPHTLRNLLWVCSACHRAIHDHPDMAYPRGLLLRSTDRIAVEIVTEAARLRELGALT